MKIFSKKQDDLFALLDEKENNSISTGETLPEPSHALTPEEVLSSKIDTSKRFDSSGALDSLKKRMRETTAKDNLTLLEKCKPTFSRVAFLRLKRTQQQTLRLIELYHIPIN